MKVKYELYHNSYKIYCEPYRKDAQRFTDNEFSIQKLEKITQGKNRPTQVVPEGVVSDAASNKEKEVMKKLLAAQFKKLSPEKQKALLNQQRS